MTPGPQSDHYLNFLLICENEGGFKFALLLVVPCWPQIPNGKKHSPVPMKDCPSSDLEVQKS